MLGSRSTAEGIAYARGSLEPSTLCPMQEPAPANREHDLWTAEWQHGLVVYSIERTVVMIPAPMAQDGAALRKLSIIVS